MAQGEPLEAPAAQSIAKEHEQSQAPPATGPAPVATPKWYEQVKLEAFVDAYSSWNFNFPKPQYNTNAGRALDNANGFALRWVGVNAGFAPDPVAGSPVGGFVSLRFGPGTLVYAAPPGGSGTPPDTSIGAGNIKEAYASWKPLPNLQLDIGKFGTWIGPETADSQYNMNYTPSALFLTQPAWHSGLRVDLPLTEQFDVKLFLVQGINNTFDNNAGKTFGASAGVMPNKDTSVFLGYMGGPEQPDVLTQVTTDPMTMATSSTTIDDAAANGRWRHLVDVIAELRHDKTHLLLNADLGTERMNAPGTTATTNTWYGANLTVGYALTDLFALAVRGGYTADAKGNFIASNWGAPLLCGTPPALATATATATCRARVVDATFTLAVTPSPHLIIKLEPRLDSLESDDSAYPGVYLKGVTGTSKTMFTTTLGVVATTN
jgi:Putative beta-barrel porin-2, OmpL-like. bbp2